MQLAEKAMYIRRHAEQSLRSLFAMFGTVLVTGARQVGKTTMLGHIWPDLPYVTLDDPAQLTLARERGATFVQDNPPPVFIDEAQYAPELFPHLKLWVDREKRKGMFLLSGSQQLHLMRHVSESMAGRVGILTLPPLSLREIRGCNDTTPFVPDQAAISPERKELAPVGFEMVWEHIMRGSLPELVANPEMDRRFFYTAYVRTYLDRDVRSLAQVGDILQFSRFMLACAARSGQLLNISSLASDVGISRATAQQWLSVLEASNVIYLLRPYFRNFTKRLVKTPKLYFLDTGLVTWLTGWHSTETLRKGAMAGAIFETWVVSEICKSYLNRGILDPPLFFYRDRDGREIDVLIEQDGTLYPIEIKRHADPDPHDVAAFRVLDKLAGVQRGPGALVCLYGRCTSLTERDRVCPVHLL